MKKKILIIEDNEDIREGTAEILGLAGYEVETAVNGKLGADKAQKYLPDLIICDIMMPELDGYGVLYLLNKNPETANIPFIFLTAKAERADMRKGMEMGADDYLIKPFDDMELLNAIESRLNKKQKQEEFYTKGLKSLEDFASQVEDKQDLKSLISQKKIRQVKKGQIIYYDQDHAQGIYLVLEGKIKTVKLSEDGRELLTGIYHTDEYFGVHDALISQLHTETAEAMENSSICMLHKDKVNALLNNNTAVAMQFIQLLSAHIHQKEEQLVQLAYHSVRKRLAETLMRIREVNKNQDIFKISRDDLAAMAGMATETVSRTLSDFKEEKLIEKKGGEIHILDVNRLKNMKN
jgi:DNA-binding response OmpR family regulator